MAGYRDELERLGFSGEEKAELARRQGGGGPPASAHIHAHGAGRPRPLTPPGLGHAFGHSSAHRTRRFSGLQRPLQK